MSGNRQANGRPGKDKAFVSVVRAENLGVTVGHQRFRRWLFSAIDIKVRPGELIGLGGSSGSGKTTLGNVLLGLKKPDAGRVFWKDIDVYASGHGGVQNRRPLYQKLYQDPVESFFPGRTVGQSLRDVVSYHRTIDPDGKGGPALEHILTRLGLGRELLDRFPHQLSGGELQRMALARILLVRPEFIFADEPTSRLDLSVQAHVIRFIAELAQKDGIGIILVSHDMGLLFAVCHKVYVLEPLQLRLVVNKSGKN